MHSVIYNPEDQQRITTSLPVCSSCSSPAWHWWVTTAAGGSMWEKKKPHPLPRGWREKHGCLLCHTATGPVLLGFWLLHFQMCNVPGGVCIWEVYRLQQHPWVVDGPGTPSVLGLSKEPQCQLVPWQGVWVNT